MVGIRGKDNGMRVHDRRELLRAWLGHPVFRASFATFVSELGQYHDFDKEHTLRTVSSLVASMTIARVASSIRTSSLARKKVSSNSLFPLTFSLPLMKAFCPLTLPFFKSSKVWSAREIVTAGKEKPLGLAREERANIEGGNTHHLPSAWHFPCTRYPPI